MESLSGKNSVRIVWHVSAVVRKRQLSMVPLQKGEGAIICQNRGQKNTSDKAKEKYNMNVKKRSSSGS